MLLIIERELANAPTHNGDLAAGFAKKIVFVFA